MAIRLKVVRQDNRYVIHLLDHENESDTRQKFTQVFYEVNRAAKLDRKDPNYDKLFNEGPLLYNQNAIDPDTGKEISQLGGLIVSALRLEETLKKLRELGFEISGP